MQRKAPILVVSTLLMISFLVNVPIDATQELLPVEGKVSYSGCEKIGGNVVPNTIDVEYKQTIELCKFNNKYYRLVDTPVCTENIGQGKDPDTGKSYEFPTPCDVPVKCDGSGWGSRSNFYHNYKLQVQADGKDFDIITGATGARITCIFESFVQEEKKIGIIAKITNGIESFMTVAIPHELLSGDFEVFVDGNNTEYELERTRSGVKITIKFDFNADTNKDFELVEREINIIGTQVIPEFPINLIMVTAIGLIAMLVVFRIKGNISLRKDITHH